MARFLRELVRRRRKTVILALILLFVAGSGGAFYTYALRQWNAAREAVKQGRLAEAGDRLELCLWVWPRSVPVRLLAARTARLRGDFSAAESHLNRCRELQGGASEATQLEFFLMRVQAGEVDEVATPLLKYVERMHPDTPVILETLSGAYMRDLRYGPALYCLNLWLQETPDAVQALYCRGWVLERLENSDGAARDYKRALDLQPDSLPIRLRLVELQLNKVNYQEAGAHLAYLQQHFPDRPEVLARLGQYRFLQNDRAEARRLLEAAERQLPADPVLLITLARLEMRDKSPAKAELYLRRVLKADPTDIEAQFTLITALRQQGRDADADAALELHEKERAQLRRAHEMLQSEAERESHEPGPAYEIGSTFLRSGQERLGLYWLHKALRRDPLHQQTHQRLAAYYEEHGQPDLAAYHGARSKSPAPKSP